MYTYPYNLCSKHAKRIEIESNRSSYLNIYLFWYIKQIQICVYIPDRTNVLIRKCKMHQKYNKKELSEREDEGTKVCHVRITVDYAYGSLWAGLL